MLVFKSVRRIKLKKRKEKKERSQEVGGGGGVWVSGHLDWLVKRVLTPSCLRRSTGEDQTPRRWGKMETISNATLSSPE